ncbi:MAG: hypothetical protein V4709_14245 [Pseudomonadota bacterium]
MLLSLISVLVLLVIGFYAFWLAIVGRVAANQGPELSIVGRAVVLGMGVLALGIAYAVYSNPQTGSFSELASMPPAMSSNPPESRGSEPAAAAPPETVAAAEETPALASSEAQPKAEEAAAPVAAAEPEQPAVNEGNGLSAAAARMEAEALRPRRAAIAAAEPVAEPEPVAGPVERQLAPATTATAQRRVVAEPAARSKSTRNTGIDRRSQPLLLHVHNSLGRDQAREQLTLSIEGLAVADIEVDGSRPSVAVAVPLPRPGLLHYRLEGVSEDDGTTVLRGEGCIRVKDGARFAVRRQAGSRKVFLEQQSTRGRSAG